RYPLWLPDAGLRDPLLASGRGSGEGNRRNSREQPPPLRSARTICQARVRGVRIAHQSGARRAFRCIRPAVARTQGIGGSGAAKGGPANGGGAAELGELRRILIGQDLEQLAALQRRMDDPAVRAAETGQVLAEAVKAAPGKSLREALEPVFEKSFQNSVRKHP